MSGQAVSGVGPPAPRSWKDRPITLTSHDFDGEHSLTLTAGGLDADAAVVATGHEPNGHFWQGLVRFAWPDAAERLAFDSEGAMFCALGSPDDLARLKAALEPVVSSPSAVREPLARAEGSDFEFDD
ncbi:hypothetical protein KGD83_14460 [Nocardiopsis akebiae]|uniref:Immunity protein 51 of polymorphic toxin system n=1 Tax=Nocardiopsis akebiae TaxID=2831968 RepID=A0ABX8BWU9_9ACTN|nr:Imm51 family immunity protein [Nocardiopsis akebiae]QUX26611.1 hypothetical protein KGD83_14460 [Nocardiopsis akebiae]